MSNSEKKEKKPSGFKEYLIYKKFTPNFIHDFDYWCKKIYKRWKYLTEYEDFHAICWEALLTKIDQFDPSIATIQTFCISRINNEALRIYMKNKQKRIEIDCDDPVLQDELKYEDGQNIYLLFEGFVKYAQSLGVTVNVDKLFEDYTEEKYSPPVLAFISWKLENEGVGGRDDISKRKR